MRKLAIYTIAISLFAFTSSCSDWFDVGPRTEVKSDDLYSTEAGYKSALTGIYVRMTSSSMYGGNLTFNFLERVVQRYDNYQKGSITDKELARIYDYKNDADSKAMLTNIWNEMYRTIANVNELISFIDRQGVDIIATKGLMDLMKGEALGLRAFLHFDLLRMWGPIYKDDPTAKCIVYRIDFNADQMPLEPANEIVDKIIDDLLAAELLLKNDAMNFNNDMNVAFFSYRKHRMNLYAVKSMLARVYLYKGEKGKAEDYALEVINNMGLSLSDSNTGDPNLYGEHIFCLDIYDMHKELQQYFKKEMKSLTTEFWISKENMNTVFESNSVGVNDIRQKDGTGFIYSMDKAMLRKYLEPDESTYKNKMPLIRLSEMYYIAAEASTSYEEASKLINKVRNARAISMRNNINVTSDASLINELNKEYQKDFFGEGQYFYFLKRHNISTFHNFPLENTTSATYIFPTPDNEVEFGVTTDKN